jgi:hypothetical protein
MRAIPDTLLSGLQGHEIRPLHPTNHSTARRESVFLVGVDMNQVCRNATTMDCRFDVLKVAKIKLELAHRHNGAWTGLFFARYGIRECCHSIPGNPSLRAGSEYCECRELSAQDRFGTR